MQEADTLLTAISITAACVAFIVRTLIEYFAIAKQSKIRKIEGLALAAFSYVEKVIPDDYGSNLSDPAYERAAHKADYFAQTFIDMYYNANGKKPSKEMMKEAHRLASVLAERRKR